MTKFCGMWLSDVYNDIYNYSLVREVYKSLIDLNVEYPLFCNWYYENVIPSLKSGKKDIFVSVNNNSISGILIIKNDYEQKICTLRVGKEYQKQGLGKFLIESSFNKLNCDKPLITVSNQKVLQFNKLFDYYNFKLEDIEQNYYKNNSIEYCYNGCLEQKSIERIDQLLVR